MSVYRLPSSGAVPPPVPAQTAPDIRPLYITEAQLSLIEGWASKAATHGVHEAWGVLSQALLWRCSE